MERNTHIHTPIFGKPTEKLFAVKHFELLAWIRETVQVSCSYTITVILLDSCTGRISWKYAERGKFSGSRLFHASRDFANISTEGEKMKAVYGVLTCMLKVRDSETTRRA